MSTALLSVLQSIEGFTSKTAAQKVKEADTAPVQIEIRQANDHERQVLQSTFKHNAAAPKPTKRKLASLLRNIDTSITQCDLGKSSLAKRYKAVKDRHGALAKALLSLRRKTNKGSPNSRQTEIESLAVQAAQRDTEIQDLEQLISSAEQEMAKLQSENDRSNPRRSEDNSELKQQVVKAQEELSKLQEILKEARHAVEVKQQNLADMDDSASGEASEKDFIAEQRKVLDEMEDCRKQLKSKKTAIKEALASDAELKELRQQVQGQQSRRAVGEGQNSVLQSVLDLQRSIARKIVQKQSADPRSPLLLLHVLHLNNGRMSEQDLKAQATTQFNCSPAMATSLLYKLVAKRLVKIDRSNPKSQIVVASI